jgi:hypothetical protein
MYLERYNGYMEEIDIEIYEIATGKHGPFEVLIKGK